MDALERAGIAVEPQPQPAARATRRGRGRRDDGVITRVPPADGRARRRRGRRVRRRRGAADGPEGEWHWLLVPSDAVVRAPPAPGRKLAPPEADGAALLVCVGHNASARCAARSAGSTTRRWRRPRRPAFGGALASPASTTTASTRTSPCTSRCRASAAAACAPFRRARHVHLGRRPPLRRRPRGRTSRGSGCARGCKWRRRTTTKAAHTEKLLDISARRLDGALFFADAAEALPQDVEKIEAAVQGLGGAGSAGRSARAATAAACATRTSSSARAASGKWAAYDDAGGGDRLGVKCDVRK